MANTDLYATLHYVDHKLIMCASTGCANEAKFDNRIQTIIGQFEGEPARRSVVLFFCDGCYREVRSILNGNYSPWSISDMEYKAGKAELERKYAVKKIEETPLAIIPTEEVQ